MRSSGSRQELAIGHSMAVMGTGQMEWCLPREPRRKDGSGQEGICINNTEAGISFSFFFFFLVLIFHDYTSTSGVKF